jgi:DNA (cytosine-5)-methyltransferase 1
MSLPRRRLRVAELYAGTGRSVEPFRHWSNCTIAGLFDNNQYAADTYLANFPGAAYYVRDLTQIRPSTIERLCGGKIDVLLGCPPCQGFSDVGTRNPRDRRNFHLRNFARLAAKLQPLAIGMENVPLAASPRRFLNFTAALEKAGYIWTAGILNGALRGSAQCRHRLVVIALREDLGIEPVIPGATHGGTSKRYYSYATGTYRTIASDRISMLGEAPAARRVRERLPFVESALGGRDIPVVADLLDGLPPLGTSRADLMQHRAWTHTPELLRRMANVPEGGRWKGGADHYSQTYGRLHRRGLARTVTTFFPNPGGGRFWHPTENRSLTLREAARLQGFPDSFRFDAPFSYAAVLVGNALDAAISSAIFKVIKTHLS